MSLLRRWKNKNSAPTRPETNPSAYETATRTAGNVAVYAAMGEQMHSPEESLQAALHHVRSSVEPVRAELLQTAPPDNLLLPGGPLPDDDIFIHNAKLGERLLIKDNVVPNEWEYEASLWDTEPPVIPDDAPRGQEVTLIGGNFLLLQPPTKRARGVYASSVSLLFMDDGRTMYQDPSGGQKGDGWLDIHLRTAGEIMALTQAVANGLEHHRTHP